MTLKIQATIRRKNLNGEFIWRKELFDSVRFSNENPRVLVADDTQSEWINNEDIDWVRAVQVTKTGKIVRHS